jgi:hypothetical protein
MIWMAFYRMTGLVAVSQLRRPEPWRSVRSTTAQFVWAVMTFLVMASPGGALRAEAQPSDANRIPIEIVHFDRGASSKDISGSVIRGERSLYSIDARSGQRLGLSISAAEDNAVFQVYTPGARAKRGDYGVEIGGSKALPGAGEGQDAKRWSGVLAVTGRYLVVVGPTRGNATYKLRVTVR